MDILSRFKSWIFGAATSVKKSINVAIRATLGGGMSGAGGWASDHREEVRHFTGYNYCAIHAIAQQVSGSTLRVFDDADDAFENRSVRKALRSQFGTLSRYKALYGDKNKELDPLPASHPLVKLLMHPNPYESRADFIYRQVLQIRLTGKNLIWNVPSVAGPTCERYVLPTAMCTFMPPTTDTPWGSWLVSPQASRYAPVVDDGFIDGGPAWTYVLGKNIDARQVQVVMYPHPFWLNDSQSPISAGANWVDLEQQINTARNAQLRNGVDGSLLWELPPDVNPDQDEVDRATAKINAKYGGPENVGKIIMAQGGTNVTPLSTTPKEMCYGEAFEQAKQANLSLHGTPEVALGGAPSGAYAAYFMSMKAWRHATVQPLCDKLAESDTQHLAPQFGEGLVIEYESDTVDDPDMQEKQLANDLAAGTITMNEWRTLRGRKPIEGPDGDKLLGGKADAQSGQPKANPDSGNPMDSLPKLNATEQPKPPQPTEQPDAEMPSTPFSKSKTLQAAIDSAHEGDIEWLVTQLKRRDPEGKLQESQLKSLADEIDRAVESRLKSYNPSEARANDGKWTDGSSGNASSKKDEAVAASKVANSASAEAKTSATFKPSHDAANEHASAGYAHDNAAKLHEKAGNEKGAAYHRTMAQSHYDEAKKLRSGPAETKPSESSSSKPVKFQTEKGSVYTDHGGKTSRQKFDGTDHGPSDSTRYVSEADSQKILDHVNNATKRGGKADMILGNKNIGLGKDKETAHKIPFSNEPAMGLVPIEHFADGGVHVGHKITFIDRGADKKSLGMSTGGGADGGFTVHPSHAKGFLDPDTSAGPKTTLCPFCGRVARSQEDANDVCETGHVFPHQFGIEKHPEANQTGDVTPVNGQLLKIGNEHLDAEKSDPSELLTTADLTQSVPDDNLHPTCPICGAGNTRRIQPIGDVNSVCLECLNTFGDPGSAHDVEKSQIDQPQTNDDLRPSIGRDDGNNMTPVPTIDAPWPPVPTLVPKVVDSPNYDPDIGNVRQESALKSVSAEEESVVETPAAAEEVPVEPEPSQVSQQENLPKPKPTNRRRKNK